MTITDTLTLTCFCFLIWRGYSRGFLASLLGPLALIIGSIVSFVYYAWTKNMLVSLCIGLFLPILLAWIFRSSLCTWNQFTNADKKLNTLSRISGACLSLTWGMAILIITVLLLAMMPPINKPIKLVFNDIHTSQLYRLIKPFDASAIDKTTAQDNMKQLSEDKRIQDIINDPQVVDAINRKDYASLINNPKITALMQDPELLKKMLSIYKEMGQPQLPQ
jgi:competence protein ComGC